MRALRRFNQLAAAVIAAVMAMAACAAGQDLPNAAVPKISPKQKQRVAVLPSVGDLDPKMLILLTDKVRELATQNLPMEDFNILKQDVITKMIGEEEIYRSCKEGVCIGDLAKKTNANYGARCDVVNLNGDLVLKFEMYSVNEESIFETFTNYGVNDFYGMLSALEARLPDIFRKMVISLKQTNELAQASDQTATNTLGEEAKPKPKSKISAGVGGFFADGSGGGLRWERTNENLAMPYSAGGAYLFFDAVYAEAFAGFSAGGGKWRSGDANPPHESSLPEMSRTCVNVGAFAKYPIGAGLVKAFPLLGFEYEASISGKLKSGAGETEFDGGDGRPKAGALSATWFKVGGGADFGLSQNLYLRIEALYGRRTANAYEKDRANEEADYSKKAEPRSASGLTIKAGAGVKF